MQSRMSSHSGRWLEMNTPTAKREATGLHSPALGVSLWECPRKPPGVQCDPEDSPS